MLNLYGYEFRIDFRMRVVTSKFRFITTDFSHRSMELIIAFRPEKPTILTLTLISTRTFRTFLLRLVNWRSGPLARLLSAR